MTTVSLVSSFTTSKIPIPYTSILPTTLAYDGILSLIDHTLHVTKVTLYGTLGPTYTVTDSNGRTTTSTYAYPTSTGWVNVPLTTTFTPPSECFTNWHAYSWSLKNAQTAMPTFYLPNGDRVDCFPKDFFIPANFAYYSPGICPSGYSVVSSGNITSTRSAGIATISQAACCPSGFHKLESSTLWIQCYSSIPATSTRVEFFYLPSTTITYGSGSTSVITGSETSNGFVDVTSGGQLNGNGMVIQWESTDQIVLDWLASQTITHSNSTVSPVPAPPPVIPHHGISAGAIAGIAVGAVAVLAFLILGVWLFLRRRKRNQNTNQQDFPEHVNPPVNSHAIITPEKGFYSDQATNPHELGSEPISRTVSPDTHPPYLSPSARWTQGSGFTGKDDRSELSTGPSSPVINMHGSQNSSPTLGGMSPPQNFGEFGSDYTIEHAPAYSRPMGGNDVPPNSGLPPVQEQYRPYRPDMPPT